MAHVFNDIITSFRRARTPQPIANESRPSEQDLALQILRTKYRQYLQTPDQSERETKLFQLIPLFNKTCTRMKEDLLVERFGDVFDFAENVAFVFVRHVTQLAQSSPSALLEYFETDCENPSAGMTLLKGACATQNEREKKMDGPSLSNLVVHIGACAYQME